MELGREVSTFVLSQAKIEALRMPENVKKVFVFLGNEKNIGVKGGHAKLLFQVLLRQWGEIRGKQNWKAQGFDGALFDLDIILACKNMSDKALAEEEKKRVNPLIEKLQGIIEVKGKNIEAVQTKGGNITDGNFIDSYLQGQDMTINEIIAISAGNGSWTLYFTDKCKRDTINGAGILAAGSKNTVRWHNGMMIASQKGMIRLVQALVESKVKSIYLPQLWIDMNREEALRLHQENLGYYGFLMCQRYLKNPVLQRKLMTILKNLKITNISDFADFYNEQTNAAKLFNSDFHYNPNMTFFENQQSIKKRKGKRKESRKESKRERFNCEHKHVETSICKGCQWNCKIWKCLDCNSTKIQPKHSKFFVKNFSELLCNKNFVEGNWYWNKKGWVY
jgi:hypothetical protein